MLSRLLCLSFALPLSAATKAQPPHLPKAALAQQYFGADAPWFLANIPFFEIDDAQIQQVYYYRWKLYRSHIRDIGAQGTDETEFLADVPWAGHPYTDLNDSSSFHIMEGRWLRDPTYVRALVDHLYTGGGNDRHFSESIAAATYAWTQVTGDAAPAIAHLDAMQHIYNLWNDHFDAARNLYWIEPIADATEYTIASIDASGAGFTNSPSNKDSENGFLGGFAFRPSINAYQFANAQAIAQLALAAHLPGVAATYTHRAEALRTATLAQLWNPALGHFTDIYQRPTRYVTAGNFIRGRELVGYLPWLYELPPATSSDYDVAWNHLLAPSELAGPFGLRTTEPSYHRYLVQYRYDVATGLPECQWNGPSWPFQTSQTLAALANVLRVGHQQTVTPTNYIHLLRQYTRQHFLNPTNLDLQEDYNPDTGKPIVGLPRSHHYNHSTYNDLIVTGLVGLHPRSDNILEVAPLLPEPASPEKQIHFFALEDVRYHGHDLSIVYDADGTHYHLGAGLSIFSDQRRIAGPVPVQRTLVPLAPAPETKFDPPEIDLAVNVQERAPSPFEQNLPIASASSTASDSTLYGAIDGRLWFFPEIPNGWSPVSSAPSTTSWYAVDLRSPATLGAMHIAFFSDGALYQAPPAFDLQVLTPSGWKNIEHQHRIPRDPIANGVNEVTFPPVTAQQVRVVFPPSPSRLRLIEVKVFAPK